MAENHKRAYRRRKDWLAFYSDLDSEEPITNLSVSRVLGISRSAARKLTSRQVASGILMRSGNYPQSFDLSKNVTLHMVAPSPNPEGKQVQQGSNSDIKISTNKPPFRQSLQKKEHSLQVSQDRPRSNMAQKHVTLTIPPSPAYMASFPDCRCVGAFICDSCQELPIVFTPAFERLQSSYSATVTALKAPVPVRASELLQVKKPIAPRWARYGLDADGTTRLPGL